MRQKCDVYAANRKTVRVETDIQREAGRGGEIKFTDVAFLHEAKLKRVCPDLSND